MKEGKKSSTLQKWQNSFLNSITFLKRSEYQGDWAISEIQFKNEKFYGSMKSVFQKIPKWDI